MANKLTLLTLGLSFSLFTACNPFGSTATTTGDTTSAQDLYLGAKIVASVAALPSCNATSLNHLYYVIETEEFKVCDVNGYTVINLKGAQGAPGSDGVDGVDGTKGIDGMNGTNGADGTNGTSGLDGDNGADGVNGVDGTKGTNGIDGIDGTKGTDGIDGTKGTDGIDGTKGTDGIDGTKGTDGIDGENGPSCTGNPISSGTELICDDTVIDTIHDGFYAIQAQNQAIFSLGEGIPDPVAGNINDTYLDIKTSIYFKKDATKWVVMNSALAITNDMIEYLIAADISIDRLLAENVTMERILTAQTLPELLTKGVDIRLLFDNGIMVKALLDNGITVDSIIRAEIMGVVIDSRDQQEYLWTTIGDQIWMAENLNYSGDDSQGNKAFTVGLCYGQPDRSDNAQCDISGRIYTWYEAMNGSSSANGTPSGVQGLCPTGWHFPSSDEWTTFATTVYAYVGSSDRAAVGQVLKATAGWGGNNNGTDDFGFSGAPSGAWSSYQQPSFSGIEGVYWWTATQGSNNDSQQWIIAPSGFRMDWNRRINGESVRCLKD
ncbi:MAG: hypothetical protein OCC49_19715 [Fibrobacterales bacterium]